MDQRSHETGGPDLGTVVEAVQTAITTAHEESTPFRHWRLSNLWPSDMARDLEALPISLATMTYHFGRREENNAVRAYFDPSRQTDASVCRLAAAALQDPGIVAALETLCGVDLSGTFLRIEYAQDVEGFWLEPHTDIGVKRFTMLVPLSSGPEATGWGTDFYADPEGPPQRLPFQGNTATIFVPGDDTWHGFEARPMVGVRRSLIVNYVGAEWRARHELCFPDQPVG
jgi:hypothetical protein